MLIPSLQPGLESCFAGVTVTLFCWQQELSSGLSLATSKTRQQLHPQPFCSLTKSLSVISVVMLEGSGPPRLVLGGPGLCGGEVLGGALLQHCGTMEGVQVGRLKGEKLVAVPPNCSPTSVLA